MAFRLTKAYPRLWSLDAGVAMVVTDLHGDWDSYARYRDRFIELHAAGQADCLIFTGDLIHREPDAGHGSLARHGARYPGSAGALWRRDHLPLRQP